MPGHWQFSRTNALIKMWIWSVGQPLWRGRIKRERPIIMFVWPAKCLFPLLFLLSPQRDAKTSGGVMPMFWWEFLKTSIDREEAGCLMVTVLDLCVFSPHWSASERKWEGECESHFKHLLWVWSIPKVQVSIFWRECGARGGGWGREKVSDQVVEGERTRQSNG